MLNCIARLFEPLLRLLLPALGRHRAVGPYPIRTEPRAYAPTGRLTREPMLRGEDTVMVRPYLVAHERRQAARRGCTRRRTLWLAAHGVDLDRRLFRGREAMAR